ncbi:NOL1/NOP2/sun family protein [Puniceibacterium sp. IMCC21224]|nr:NOL1/NOP2/sun family protein [Puniceibacterium sp. IMCC21224]
MQVEEPRGPYDVVLCDVPCSGSGAWRRARRSVDAATDGLAQLCSVQAPSSAIGGEGGTLAYATCSVLTEEN